MSAGINRLAMIKAELAATALNARFVGEHSLEEINIEELIRENYSLSQEVALHRKKLMGTVDPEEWDEYVAFVEECIAKARENEGAVDEMLSPGGNEEE